MLRVRHNAFPLGAGEDLREFILHEVGTILAQHFVLGDIHDVLELFFVYTVVVVHLSLVADGVQPVKMQV